MPAVSLDDHQYKNGAGGTSDSFSVTTSGDNRIVLYFVITRDGGSYKTSSVTYAGAALTLVYSQEYTSGNWIECYIKTGAASGTNTLAFSFTGDVNFWVAFGVALSNANQTTPYSSSDYNAGTGTTASTSGVSSTGTDDIQIGVVGIKSVDTIAPTSGWTELRDISNTNNRFELQYDSAVSAGANDISSTIGASVEWGAIALNIIPAGTTVSVDAGSMTIAGQTPTTAMVSDVALGTMTLTGYDVATPYIANIGLGTMTLAGLAPTATLVSPVRLSLRQRTNRVTVPDRDTSLTIKPRVSRLTVDD